MKRILCLGLLLLAIGAPAQAGEAEERWARGVAEAAGVEPGQVQARPLTRRGTEVGRYAAVNLDGLRAGRYWLGRQRDALDYAAKRLGDAQGHAVVAVRGEQVVVLVGERLAEAERARDLLKAAWLEFPSVGGEALALVVKSGDQLSGRGIHADLLLGDAVSAPELETYLSTVDGVGQEVDVSDQLPPPASLDLLFGDVPERTGPAPRVVLVTIDEATQDDMGPFGASYRQHHDDLIKRLNELGARGIGFDMYVPENAEFAAETAAIAEAAATSKAPVVFVAHTQQHPDGRVTALPNAPAIADDRRIGEASASGQYELVLEGGIEAANAEYQQAVAEQREPNLNYTQGAFGISTRVGPYPTLIEELAVRTGDLHRGELRGLGLSEPVTTGLGVNDDGELVEVPSFLIRPEVGDPASVTRFSYADVLKGRGDLSAIDGALVLIGMDDGVNDVLPDPDPSQPDLKRLSGVYVHVFALQRVLAKAYEPKAPAERGGLLEGVQDER